MRTSRPPRANVDLGLHDHGLLHGDACLHSRHYRDKVLSAMAQVRELINGSARKLLVSVGHRLDAQIIDARKVAPVAAQQDRVALCRDDPDGDVGGAAARAPESAKLIGRKLRDLPAERHDAVIPEKFSRRRELLRGAGSATELVPRDGADLDDPVRGGQRAQPRAFRTFRRRREDQEIRVQMETAYQ